MFAGFPTPQKNLRFSFSAFQDSSMYNKILQIFLYLRIIKDIPKIVNISSWSVKQNNGFGKQTLTMFIKIKPAYYPPSNQDSLVCL